MASSNPYKRKRFAIGTDVVCRTGPDDWSKGKIVALDYREPDWPEGAVVPYQVELEDGNLIFVPADLPQLARSSCLNAGKRQ